MSNSMTKALALVLALSSVAFAQKHAKRAAPKDVKPVVHEGVRYVASHRMSIGGTASTGSGFVEAWDVKKKKKLWEAKLYETANDPEKEQDVQHVFITTMHVEGGKLVVINERKQTFEVDLASHEVSQR